VHLADDISDDSSRHTIRVCHATAAGLQVLTIQLDAAYNKNVGSFGRSR